MIRIQNFGAGTQSVGLALMALDGKFENVPDEFVFADTGAEPNHVYDYLNLFKNYFQFNYGKKITVVSYGNLETQIFNLYNGTAKRLSNIPVYTANGSILKRNCTQDYKIHPIEKWIKSNYKIGRKKKDSIPIIEQWFGISLDEIHRCKISQNWWSVFYYPLVLNRLYRYDVIRYVTTYHNLPEPPRSSCYFCPFHSNKYWRFLKDNHNQEFNKAIEIDKMIRQLPKMRNKTFLHKSHLPLQDADLRTNSEKGQPELIEECEGYCGV